MRKKFAYEIVTNVRLGGGTGRRTGLKIRSPARGVRVRFPPQALVTKGGSMKILLALAIVLVIAVPSFAADVDGKWSGTIMGPMGDIPVAFTFKADGEKLTGSTVGLDGAEVPISEGKINGKNITFKVSFYFGGMPFVISYKGVVSAEEIQITGSFFEMPFEFVLKKAKP